MVTHVCGPTYLKGRGRRTEVQGWPSWHKILSEKQPKNTQSTGGMAQVVEHSPSKHETLSSIPTIRKKERRKKKEIKKKKKKRT
jgi:hypothetical protein